MACSNARARSVNGTPSRSASRSRRSSIRLCSASGASVANALSGVMRSERMRQATSSRLSTLGRLAGGTALAAGQLDAEAKAGKVFLQAFAMIPLDFDSTFSHAAPGARKAAELHGQLFQAGAGLAETSNDGGGLAAAAALGSPETYPAVFRGAWD